MYLNIGGDTLLPVEEIVGIFDLDITSQSHRTRAFLRAAEQAGQVVNAAEDIPKSFVVCRGSRGTRVYLSQLMSATLFKRAAGTLGKPDPAFGRRNTQTPEKPF